MVVYIFLLLLKLINCNKIKFGSLRNNIFSSSTKFSLPMMDYGTELPIPFNQQNRLMRFIDKTMESSVEDDGFSDSNTRHRMLKSFAKRVFRRNEKPGTLILIRHGETVWNYNSTFTGWVDADLSERGQREIEHASRLLLERGYTVDIAFTSRLKRAIRSTWIVLKGLNQIYRPAYKSWRLNERMYGALEGTSKIGAAVEYGEKQVQLWRRDLSERPPVMKPDHVFWHAKERKYGDLDTIPVTESLEDTMVRTLPLWQKRILPALKNGQNVLVVAHANSLRGLVKYIDNLDADQIYQVGIPNGIPLIYKFDKHTMEPVQQEMAVAPLNGAFLEKKGALRLALEKEEELAKAVPGYRESLTHGDARMSEIKRNSGDSPSWTANNNDPQDPLVRGLLTLDEERKLIRLASDTVNNIGNNKENSVSSSVLNLNSQPTESSTNTNTNSNTNSNTNDDDVNHPLYPLSLGVGEKVEPSLSGPQLVIIRHGKTEHNKLGLFTGWYDAPLAMEGRKEATQAGRLMREHGLEFDTVYTSWLSRAIETAWIVLDELDCLWLPIIKSWRLNERMYGALTGLSKKMIKERHGNKQFMKWRRGYDTRPPRISSYSSDYPGNDDRYRNYVKDVRYSLSESIIRTLANGRPELHRKFPRSESLQDCMERTIPFLKSRILPDVENGKSVLVASSENAIRGILMELLDIPTEDIHSVEIPTGLPMVLDVKQKCIRLFDDGNGEDPLERYNFGSNPELLFTPCCDVGDDKICYLIGGRSYAFDPLIRRPENQIISTSKSKINKEDVETSVSVHADAVSV